MKGALSERATGGSPRLGLEPTGRRPPPHNTRCSWRPMETKRPAESPASPLRTNCSGLRPPPKVRMHNASSSSHVGCPGERNLGSCRAQRKDVGDSGRPARPGVATGALLPLPHPHHPALGHAGDAAARTLPLGGEGARRPWPPVAKFEAPPRAAIVPWCLNGFSFSPAFLRSCW